MKGTLNMDTSNMNNIESRVQSYWTKRAHNFNIVRKNELNSSISERWREEIVHFLPEGKVLQILDVGTGTGARKCIHHPFHANEPETASLLGSGISGKHRLFQIRIRPFRRSEYLKRARPERCSYVPCMGCAVIILPHRP